MSKIISFTDGKKVWMQHLHHDLGPLESCKCWQQGGLPSGDEILELRKQKRLTLREVRILTGLGTAEISEYEHGVGYLEPDKVLKLHEALLNAKSHGEAGYEPL